MYARATVLAAIAAVFIIEIWRHNLSPLLQLGSWSSGSTDHKWILYISIALIATLISTLRPQTRLVTIAVVFPLLVALVVKAQQMLWLGLEFRLANALLIGTLMTHALVALYLVAFALWGVPVRLVCLAALVLYVSLLYVSEQSASNAIREARSLPNKSFQPTSGSSLRSSPAAAELHR